MIAELQQERKLNEREPIDWETYRQALIDSGMVDEARIRRETTLELPFLLKYSERATRAMLEGAQ